MKLNVLAMDDIEWTESGISTTEVINYNTKMEQFTKKLTPSELFESLEAELDKFDVDKSADCINLEAISADVLYTIMVLSQRNLSNHTGKPNLCHYRSKFHVELLIFKIII